ncbi:anti-sigma factor antagonist [Amycolatopsis acidicola]|uniref:Anti-sigma factor antagonist n=1 Tax=Amycolatopsis acidicola TaxID=2596893 RepID=A0A5N0UKW7_9PSEU|nr:anti-sigma factor antagonist [Amycolatopsis acidicola]KAA9150293.1 anti-sigma factor antagonist [Amycolatopsis acidicola]
MSEFDEVRSLPVRATDLLRVRREDSASVVVLHFTGDIDLSTAGFLAEQLRLAEESAAPPASLVADLEGVGFLGSAGLMVLARQQEQCERRGIPFLIVGSSRAVVRSIEMAGLETVLRVVPTIQEALAV